MDDTLLNTSGGIEQAWELACREVEPELGCDWAVMREAIRKEAREFWKDEAAVEHWRVKLTEAREHVVKLALDARGLDPALAPRLNDRYMAEVSQRIEPFDDAWATLDRLRSRGYRLALLTNGPAEMQLEKIARFQVERHFDVVVIEGVFGRGKPNREVFDHALSVTGVASNEAWHVGDNLYADIGGAKNAGLSAVWIHRDRLEMAEGTAVVPDLVIGHLAELTDVLAT